MSRCPPARCTRCTKLSMKMFFNSGIIECRILWLYFHFWVLLPDSPWAVPGILLDCHFVTGPDFQTLCGMGLFLKPDSFNTRYQVKSINHRQTVKQKNSAEEGCSCEGLKFNQHLSCGHHCSLSNLTWHFIYFWLIPNPRREILLHLYV